MRFVFVLGSIAVVALLLALSAEAHLAYKRTGDTRAQIHATQTKNLSHARYVCQRGARSHKRWACKAARGWLLREWRETLPRPTGLEFWKQRQIAAAELIGQGGDRGGTDPWPNCADPYDHRGASWTDTVRCENRGYWETYRDDRVWLDSPGFYRCGLQFHPNWERKFGRLCP